METNPTKTPFKRLLNTGKAEGISFLVLLFIAMPLKYMANMPEAVKIVGMLQLLWMEIKNNTNCIFAILYTFRDIFFRKNHT